MVVGGYYDPYSGEDRYTTEDPYLSDVELLSLDSANPVPPCLMSLNNFPVGLFGASGSVGDGNATIFKLISDLGTLYFFSDGLPIVCGGYTYSDESAEECYKYSPLSDSWQIYGSMPNVKVFSGHAYVENFGLVMAGSYSGDDSSVTVTRDGLNFEELAPLPYGDWGGCLTAVDDQTLIYSGGRDNYLAAYSYDIPGNSWTM